MRLGGEMHHPVWLEIRDGGLHGRGVADIGLEMTIARMILDCGEGRKIAGVGELVDVENLMTLREQQPHEI